MSKNSTEFLYQQLIDIGKEAVRSGLVFGSGGNLSVRNPENNGESFFITKTGTWLDQLDQESFVELSIRGEKPVDTNASSEWKLHAATYAKREDINAIVHLHPQYAVLLTALKRNIRFFTLDDALYVERYAIVPYAPNGSDELANNAATEALNANCVILEHHGCSCLGETVQMAYRRACLLEQAAKNTFNALLLNDHDTTFPKGVELVHR